MNDSEADRKKLLYICHRIPYPPNKGDKIRSFNILKHLSSKFQVYLAFLIDSKDDVKHVDRVREFAREVSWDVISPKYRKISSLFGLLRGSTYSVAYFYSRKLEQQISDWLGKHKFAAILVYSSSMSDYGLGSSPARKVIDLCDVESEKWLQYSVGSRFPISALYRLEARRLRDHERVLASQYDSCVVISEEERSLLKRIAAATDPIIVNNGIDLEAYDGQCHGFHEGDAKPIAPYIVFTGVMNYKPNVDAVCWFAKEIFPQLRVKLPGMNFYIVGADPARAVRSLAKQHAIYVTGYVNDVRPYIKNARAFVAPMRITCGVPTKILEAMACGTPVVTTREAAIRLGASGQDVLVGVNATDFANKTLRLLADNALQTKLVQNSFALLRSSYNWEQNLDGLMRAIDGCVAKSSISPEREILV